MLDFGQSSHTLSAKGEKFLAPTQAEAKSDGDW